MIQVTKEDIRQLLATVPTEFRNETLNKYDANGSLHPAAGGSFYESAAFSALENPKIPFWADKGDCAVKQFSEKLVKVNARGTVSTFADRFLARYRAISAAPQAKIAQPAR